MRFCNFYPEKGHLILSLSKRNSLQLILFTSPKFWALRPLNHKSGNVFAHMALWGGSGNRGCKLGEAAPDHRQPILGTPWTPRFGTGSLRPR